MARATAVMKALRELLKGGGERALRQHKQVPGAGLRDGDPRVQAKLGEIDARYAAERELGAPKRLGNADPIRSVPPQADDVYFDNPTKAAGEFAGRSGPFGGGKERRLFQMLHDNPSATDEELAGALDTTPAIVNILKRRLGAGGFDIQNRGRPETAGPMDRGEFETPRQATPRGPRGFADPISAVAPEPEMAGAGLSKAPPKSIGGMGAPLSPQSQQKIAMLAEELGGRPFTQQDYDQAQFAGGLLNEAEVAEFNKLLRQLPDGRFIIASRGMSVE